MGAEADSVVRDTACTPRHDDPRSVRCRQDAVRPRADEGAHSLRTAAQGDAHEPQSDHGAADVWSSRRRHQRLDRRHLLYALETNTQDEEGDAV